MIKRILAGAAAAGFAASLLTAGSATAATCPNNAPQQSTDGSDTLATSPADGGIVYGDQVGTGGYIGISGSHGFLEASSNNGLGGQSTDAPIDGRITPAGGVCIAGTTIN